MKQKIMTFILTGALVTSMFSLTSVSATEIETSIIETLETEAEMLVEEEPEMMLILHTQTSRSEETPHQVSAKFEIPSGFNLSGYVQFADETGTIYQITASDENGYSDYAFLSEGTYNIVTYGIVNDYTSQYPVSLMSDETFMVGPENNGALITLRIKGYEEIEETIKELTSDAEPEETMDTVKLVATGMEGILMDGNGNLYYETISESEVCTATIYGNATGNYDVVIEIVKAGVVGEAQFQYSFDGGVTFEGIATTDTVCAFSRGFSIEFKTENDTDELAVGDKFLAHTPETFAVSKSHAAGGNVIIGGSPENDYNVIMTILSTGKRGVSKFAISFDNGNSRSVVDVVPEDGIYQYGELIFYFSDDTFSKDVTYSANVKSNVVIVNYVPAIILGTGLCIGALAGYFILLSKKEKPKDYRINRWKDRHDADFYK